MAATLPKLEGEIILATATVVGTFGAFTITMPAGRYFLCSPGTGALGFLAELANQMEISMGAGASSVTVDDNNDGSFGVVTIARSGAFAIAWSSTAIRDLLGFSGNRGAATSHVSNVHAKYLWLPNCSRSGVMAPTTSGGALETDQQIAMGTDGTVYGTSYSLRALDSMEFRHVRGAKAWADQASLPNEAFEDFYRTVIALGLRVRYYRLRDTDGTRRTWYIEDGGHYQPVPFDARWTEGPECLWGFRYAVRETS